MLKFSTALLCASVVAGFGADAGLEVIKGPAYSHFHLTLEDGWRTESVGPFFYEEQVDTGKTWAIPPFYDRWSDSTLEATESDYIYPFLTIRRYGENYRWQFFQLFSFAGGPTQEDVAKHRFTLFPIYFRQTSPDPKLNYTAVVPIYGHLVNRLFRDDIRFVMFPLYSKTRKKDVVVSNLVYPFFDIRRGDNMHGWQFWPLYGHDVKGVTYKTNITDEVETIGGYDHKFVLWPFYFRDHLDLGTDHPEDRVTFIPFYNRSHTPKRDSKSWGFPFGHTIVDDREKGYHESDWFWPLYVHADGSKTTRRVWPIYSHATSTNGLESHWYGWFLWKKNRLKSEPLDRQRTRILYFLYSDITEDNTQTKEQYRRVDFWPFYTFRRDMEGRQRLQVMAIVEPWLPNNTSVVREYAPVYSFWIDERNPKTGVRTQSLLWNLYRREIKSGSKTPNGKWDMENVASKKVSLFFGLYQSERSAEGKRVRWFYLPSKQHKKEAGR